MKGATALKKIRARAKQLKKKSPGAKFQNLMKKAGAEYRAGKLKTKKRKAPKKKAAKRRSSKRRRISAVSKVGAVRRVCRRRKAAPKRRRARVGAKGNGFMWLILGAAALIGVVVITNNRRQQVQYIPTGNVTRDNTASQILAYAQAANLTAAAVANLIKQINASNDSGVQNIYDVIKTNPGSFENVAGVGYVQGGYARPVVMG